MENTLQFKRTYSLIIGQIGSRKGLEVVGDEDENSGLNISFSIKKYIDNKENSNTCTIDIYNLSEDSIRYIQQEEMAIILKVGYKGNEDFANNKEIFRGIISEIETDDRSSKKGHKYHKARGGDSDRKTSLKCIPADSLTYQPTISKTFPANTTPRQIINYLVSQSGTIARASFNSDVIDTKFPFGYSVNGTVKSILSDLSRDYGIHYRLDGKRLSVSDPNKYQSPNSVERAFVISPSTGLLGTPSFASGDGKKIKGDTTKNDGVKLRMLINPLVKPGTAISIKDTIITGVYRVDSIEYNGEWRGNKWEATCYCARLPATEI